MSSSAKAVKVSGSAAFPRRGDERGVGGDADLAAGGVPEPVVVLGSRVQPGHPRVHEEPLGVQRPGRPQHAGLPVPHRDVGDQCADLGLDRGAVTTVSAVVDPDPDRP